MQICDHYFTTQICIFLLIKQLNGQLFFCPWKSSIQNEPVMSQVKKGYECSIGEITFLAKLAYSTIAKCHCTVAGVNTQY